MLLKAGLFLLLGAICLTSLIAASPRVSTVIAAVALAWAAARFYYFCFYVITAYIDPAFRFSGVFSVIAYWLRRGR